MTEHVFNTLTLKAHLLRQMAWSHATFGPGQRTLGVLDHIRKELAEVEAADGAADEWVDVAILALDGLTRQVESTMARHGHSREAVADAVIAILLGKQGRNERRTWPDWRLASADKAIEHDRSFDEIPH